MRALLDVNVLIALLDAKHCTTRPHGLATQQHRARLGDLPDHPNGCLRIMAQPAYPSPLPVTRIAERLAEAMATADHVFWPDDVSLVGAGVIDWRRVVGPRQITDVYLLAMAVQRQGRFVTFDARISPSAIVRARDEQLCVI